MNITHIRPKDGLYDVSVCVAVGREGLFYSMALPSILAARPKDIVVAQGDGLASAKWDACADASDYDACFVCADDFVLNPRCIEYMDGALKQCPDAAIAYSHHFEVNSPMSGAFMRMHSAKPWADANIMARNHIGIYTYRKSVVRLDPTLARYEDWDLMIRLHKDGKFGVLIDEPLVMALFTGDCISKPDGELEARQAIFDRHKG